MSRETILSSYINTVKEKYDYVLIDCMPSLGMMTINALAAADSVIIPVTGPLSPRKRNDTAIANPNVVYPNERKMPTTKNSYDKYHDKER